MKKTLLVILAITILAASVPAKSLSLALTVSYLGKTDSGFKEVYGAGGILPGLRFEAGVWKGLSLYCSYDYFSKKGTTPALGQEAKTREHFLSVGAAWKGALGEKLDWSLFGGLLYVSYREEALDEKVTGNAMGAEIGAGLDYRISSGLFLFPYASYMAANDTVGEIDVKLGGFKAGVGLGLRF
jgi:hypothetical protein